MAEAAISSATSQEGRVKTPRTTIQVSPLTKDKLDLIKQEANAETYDEAILFLFRKHRRSRPSAAGTHPGISPFVREEEDPYRVRH